MQENFEKSEKSNSNLCMQILNHIKSMLNFGFTAHLGSTKKFQTQNFTHVTHVATQLT